MSGPESELQKRLKGIQWQNGNCLSCIWFATKDPLNADLFDRAKCIHPKLKIYQLVVSGRDWCSLYEEIKQKQIEHKQELALKTEEKTSKTTQPRGQNIHLLTRNTQAVLRPLS